LFRHRDLPETFLSAFQENLLSPEEIGGEWFIKRKQSPGCWLLAMIGGAAKLVAQSEA